METDDLRGPVLADGLNDLGQSLLYDGASGKVEIHELTEVMEHLAGVCGDDGQAFEQPSLYEEHEVGKDPHQEGPAVDLLNLRLSPEGNAQIDAALDKRSGQRRDIKFFLLLYDEVVGMVVSKAVFLAGVAGNTIVQYKGILAMRYFQYLSFGAFSIDVY